MKLEVVDGTHPVVHPAAGSHANYYDAALFLGRSGQQGFGCDDTRDPGADLRPAVALVPSDATRGRCGLPLAGLHRPLGPAREELLQRPDRPQHQGPVDRPPLTWTDTEGAANAYAVPASGLFGTQATSAFCSIVTSGSEALRVAINNPALDRAGAARARRRRPVARPPHHLDPRRPAAARAPSHHRAGRRRRVADVPRPRAAVRGDRPPDRRRDTPARSRRRVDDVDRRVPGRRPEPLRRRGRHRRAGAHPAVADHAVHR